ncbi:MAG: hypothetical protein MJ188_01805 [Treponema sp.]|nr:hypothetical protein [Treponema sp.]
MKIVKVVSVSAAIGFLLSLFFGFFSHSGFLHIFLTALIFAVVFAVLSVAIYFVYDRFLADSSASSLGGEDGGLSSSPKAAGAVTGGSSRGSTGHVVDITIAESDLEQTGNANHYAVGEHKQMLNPEDYSEQKEAASTEIPRNPRDEFVPLRREETVDNFSGTESIAPGASRTKNASDAGNSGFQAASLTALSSGFSNLNTDSSDGTDVLPDMGDMSRFVSESEESEDSDSDESMSNESSTGSYSSGFSSRNQDSSSIKDAPLIAKAISSILAEET